MSFISMQSVEALHLKNKNPIDTELRETAKSQV